MKKNKGRNRFFLLFFPFFSVEYRHPKQREDE